MCNIEDGDFTWKENVRYKIIKLKDKIKRIKISFDFMPTDFFGFGVASILLIYSFIKSNLNIFWFGLGWFIFGLILHWYFNNNYCWLNDTCGGV